MNGCRATPAIVALLLCVLSGGCGASRLAMRPVSYEVDLRLDPSTNSVDATAAIDLESIEPDKRRGKSVLELQLHPELEIESVDLGDATLHRVARRAPRKNDGDGVTPATWRLVVEPPGDEMRLVLGYRGRLEQDASAGEEEGQIHNYAISAHVGDDGIYLEPSGYWYPRVEPPSKGDPARLLSDYRLSVEPLEGFELVAGLERDGPVGDDGKLRWSSPFPLDGLVLLGGPLSRWSRQHGDVELHVVLDPEKQAVAEDLLAASAEYLDRYETIVGPYPFREFTVLEAFFSSGFAFPTCTQIVGSQLSERQQYRRHGYLDHELLHNWWGNGVLVDPRDGNWCEGLTSYLTNYYGHILEGDDSGARKQRRNYSNFLSEIEPERDLPLGTFGQEGGAGRGIGYQKAAAVFHMLEREIGSDALFAALQQLTEERMGRHASWNDLFEVFERTSGTDLDGFLEQWVRRGGAPQLTLQEAQWKPGSRTVSVTIHQGEPVFSLGVPLRLDYGDRTEDVVVDVDEAVETVEIDCKPRGLKAVELDPDYHLFRKLGRDEAMPTSRVTRRGPKLLIVTDEGDTAEAYRQVADSYRRAVLGTEDEPKEGNEVVERVAPELTAEELEAADVLILGDAVRQDVVREFLSRTRAPVSWTSDGFTLDGKSFTDPGNAVFFTVHHPDREGGGVTVYSGNSEPALANAGWLGYYANSLLVFETPVVEGADPDPGTTRVVERRDFEFHDRIEF